MGQINLFASTLTPPMRDFLNSYQEGALWKVALSRVLDERDFPHAWAVEDKLEHSYILIEVSEPLLHDDINWLYRCIVDGQWEFTRQGAMAYAIERVLNPPDAEPKPNSRGKRQLRRTPESDAEWDKVREFRRMLEAPAIAFRHFKKTFIENGGHLQVYRYNPILVIEYDAIEQPRRRQPGA